MKFEYLITRIEEVNFMAVARVLDRFDADGWELVDATWMNFKSHRSVSSEKDAGVFTLRRPRIDPLAQKIEAEGREARKVLMEEAEKAHAHLRALREADREEIRRHSDKQLDTPQKIRPLFIDSVAVCTGSNCEQFDIIVYKCKLAGAVVYGSACPVWYKREGKYAPPGIVQFIHDRESFCPEPENNWEPLVKKIEKAMEDFAHPCWKDKFSCDETTEKRRAAVEIVLCAVENAGYEVLGKGGGP